MKSIAFTVPGDPVGKERARSTRRGFHYTPKKTVDYEAQVAHAFLKAKVAWEREHGEAWDVEGAYELTLELYSRTYARPDSNNVEKIIEDGLNKLAWCDDKRAWEHHKVYRVDPRRPRVEALVTLLHSGAEVKRLYKEAAKERAQCRKRAK